MPNNEEFVIVEKILSYPEVNIEENLQTFEIIKISHLSEPFWGKVVNIN